MASHRFDLEERLLEFAAAVVRFSRLIERSTAGLHVSNQLLRSATSPLANHAEAEAAKSRRDFVHRLRTSLQELRESHRWLRLIQKVPLTKQIGQLESLLQETDQLIRIFYASIRTAESSSNPRPGVDE